MKLDIIIGAFYWSFWIVLGLCLYLVIWLLEMFKKNYELKEALEEERSEIVHVHVWSKKSLTEKDTK